MDELFDLEPSIGGAPNPIKIIRRDNTVQGYYTALKNGAEKLLVEIDLNSNTTTIYPTNTIEDSTHFFEPKYKDIIIEFDGFNVDIEDSTYNGEDVIIGLPEGFTKTVRYGLGLEKKYKIIITTILMHASKCKKIIISRTKTTAIENNVLIINNLDFDKICRGIDRNNSLYQSQALVAKESFVYENLLHSTDAEAYPELKTKPQKDFIYKIIRNTDLQKLSDDDKQSLSQLKDTADLSYLTILTAEFEKKLSENHIESTYQRFFEENPLLLTMFAGSPYVKFKNQAYVGGKSFDNTNGQYPDFLQKHKITNNTFIVEIKTPQTLLLEKKPYRETGVYSASKDLSGAISQLLTQKYQLETDIASLIKNAEDREVEAYNVQGLIIIGRLSDLEKKEMKRSFELYRNNQKNLRITTYDECLEQLKCFVGLLEKDLKQQKYVIAE
ncbi:MAG: Shedu immune nuclease family protein [Draconibacterium sp.]